MNLKEPPDFINEDGVKWWIDTATNSYIKSRKLEGIKAWIVEKDECITRVLTDNSGVVFESQFLEDIAVRIDMLKMKEKYGL